MPAPQEPVTQDARRESAATGFTVIMAIIGGVTLYLTVAAVVRAYLTGPLVVAVSIAAATTLAALTVLAARFAPQLLEAEIVHRSGGGPRDELQDQIIVRALGVTGSVALLATGLATIGVALADLDGDLVLPVLFALLWVCVVAAQVFIRRTY